MARKTPPSAQKGKAVPPTMQDSLALLANTRALKNYYLTNPSYKAKESLYDFDESAHVDNLKNVLSFNPNYERDVIRRGDFTSYPDTVRMGEYYKPIDRNKYMQRELNNYILDMRSPYTLYDRRIEPKGIIEAKNINEDDVMFGDEVQMYSYPELQVTPWKYLTPEQRVKRQKMFGVQKGEPDLISTKVKKAIKSTPKVATKQASLPIETPKSPVPEKKYKTEKIAIKKRVPNKPNEAFGQTDWTTGNTHEETVWVNKRVPIERDGGHIGYTTEGRDYSPAWGGQFQNGGEMKYYQNGLDFVPKTISRDGGEIMNVFSLRDRILDGGGIVKDDRGYWNPDNWGKSVRINSPYITMKGVHQPLVGISDEGEIQMMYPEQDYVFGGKSVTEIPMAALGINQLDEKTAEHLDQLTNFTNMNQKKYRKGQTGVTITPGDFNPTYGWNPNNMQYPTYQSLGQSSSYPQQYMMDSGSANSTLSKLNLPKQTGTSAPQSGTNLGNKLSSISMPTGIIGDVIGGIQTIKEEKKKAKSLRAWEKASGIMAKAAGTREEEPERRYIRPEDIINTGEEFFPIYGVGTNPIAQDGAMVSALGKFADAGGTDALSRILTSVMGESGGSDIGGTVGGTVGQVVGTIVAPGVGGSVGKMAGQIGGQLAGGLIDPYTRQIKKSRKGIDENINRMLLNQGITGSQGQWVSHMEEGGNVNPQVVKMMRDHSAEDYYNYSQEGMNTLRTGGQIRQNAMDGDLKVYKGGAELMSYNPYLPDGGETVMFRGPSHDEGGMPISYGGSPVEVEGGEPATKLRDGGGDNNLVVFGNLVNPMTGKKFKKDAERLAKDEAKQNKLITSSTTKIGGLENIDKFDRIAQNSLMKNIEGANTKLKQAAETKTKMASLQNAINETAEEMGLVADNLAKGKIKRAQTGGEFKNIAKGTGRLDYNTPEEAGGIWAGDNYSKLWIPKVDIAFSDPATATKIISNLESYSEQDADDVKALLKGKSEQQKIKIAKRLATDRKVGPYHRVMNNIIDTVSPEGISTDFVESPDYYPTETLQPDLGFVPKEAPEYIREKGRWIKPAMDAFNSIVPYLRPSDMEPLDPRQLAGEMYALSTNQLEPVQASLYHPQLDVPYDISYQDILNENQAAFRAASRLAGDNPAAQSILAGQKYEANQKVLGEQFRRNQEMKDKVYSGNRNLLNQAQLTNLGILDKQYERQTAAKSATKEITQAALNSISSKYLQNQLENRTLGTYENLYNFRYDPRYRAINMNPLTTFDMTGSGLNSRTADEDYEYIYNKEGYQVGMRKKPKEKEEKVKVRTGAIIKAIRGL